MSIRGKKKLVPAIKINNITVVSIGKIIKKAILYKEDWFDYDIEHLIDQIIIAIKHSGFPADIFVFAQKIPKIKPRFNYHYEFDNIAAIPITTYNDWIASLTNDARKDLKKAEKEGVNLKVVDFSEDLIYGIMGIHNETPIRQGKYFIHYGKDFETVKREYSTYPERNEFIAAYYENKLIGILKLVYVGELACIMEILSKVSYYNKRPTNALIAKAVELCARKGVSYLTYGKYKYGKKSMDSLVAFKKRVGFKKILYPRYYIPLTLKGKIAIITGLHKEFIDLIPGFILDLYNFIRRELLRFRYRCIEIYK